MMQTTWNIPFLVAAILWAVACDDSGGNASLDAGAPDARPQNPCADVELADVLAVPQTELSVRPWVGGQPYQAFMSDRFGGIMPPAGGCMLILSTGRASRPASGEWALNVDTGATLVPISDGELLTDSAPLYFDVSGPVGQEGLLQFNLKLIVADKLSAICDGPRSAVSVDVSGSEQEYAVPLIGEEILYSTNEEVELGRDRESLVETPYHELTSACNAPRCDAAASACRDLAGQAAHASTEWILVGIPLSGDSVVARIVVGEVGEEGGADAVLLIAPAGD